MRPRRDNRVRFGPALDDHGLPRPTLHVQRDEEEQREARELLADIQRALATLGTPLKAAPPQLTLPGTAQHFLGTTRVSEADDGTGVVDATGLSRILRAERARGQASGRPAAKLDIPVLTE